MYHTFSGDSLLLPHEYGALLYPPDEGYSDIGRGLHAVMEAWQIPVGEPTSERWRRVLHWSRAVDILLDESGLADPLNHYNQLMTAVLPEPWTPATETLAAAPAACVWANIARKSFEDGDVSDQRRYRLQSTATALGKVSMQKQEVTDIKAYTQACKAEGMLVADLLIDCMADDELRAPRAEQMRAYFWEWGKLSILADATEDFVEDTANGIVRVPCDDTNFGRLKRASNRQERKIFLRYPFKTARAANLLLSLRKS